MREPTESELSAWIATAVHAAEQLKRLFEGQEIYVAAVASSFVPFAHLTKAFRIHEAVLFLCRRGFGSEAYAISRSNIEMHITLRWITNQDSV